MDQTTHIVAAFQQFVDYSAAKKSGRAGYQDNQILLSGGRFGQQVVGYIS